MNLKNVPTAVKLQRLNTTIPAGEWYARVVTMVFSTSIKIIKASLCVVIALIQVDALGEVGGHFWWWQMDIKEIILKCMEVNHKYIRLPAGKVAGLETMTSLYNRIAEQCLTCAQAWGQDSPCPDHEPATDAFAWGVVAWSDAFGLSMKVDQVEWGKYVVYPHEQFAQYLRPGRPPEPLEEVDGSPANVILSLDARWTELVIKLTAKWGLVHHLKKDKDAMIEAQNLIRELKNPASSAYKAFLESDLVFFRALFQLFPFSDVTRNYIHNWLARAEQALPKDC